MVLVALFFDNDAQEQTAFWTDPGLIDLASLIGRQDLTRRANGLCDIALFDMTTAQFKESMGAEPNAFGTHFN